MKADAIIWDYGSTLLNSVTRNIDITEQILGAIAPGLTGEIFHRVLSAKKPIIS